MAKIIVKLMSPAARGRFGLKHRDDTIEVEEKNMTMYLAAGIAVRVTDSEKPTKRTAKKASGGVERATK